MEKFSDQLKIGEKYEPLELTLSKELNDQFVRALDCTDSPYEELVHPGVILNFCSITQSPSFTLDEGIAAVGAKFASVFHQPIRVESRLTIDWHVTDVYERRSRTYQVCRVSVKNDDILIMERTIKNTFIGGVYLERRVQWEKDSAYRRSIPMSSFPEQGYEIIGRNRQLSIDRMRLYSGGMSGFDWPARNIHTDRSISIRSGVGRPVASGLMFEGYLVELITCFFGEGFFFGGKTWVTAIEMAGDGDTVIPKMVLKKVCECKASDSVEADLWCENQYGKKIMVGGASFSVPKRKGERGRSESENRELQ